MLHAQRSYEGLVALLPVDLVLDPAPFSGIIFPRDIPSPPEPAE